MQREHAGKALSHLRFPALQVRQTLGELLSMDLESNLSRKELFVYVYLLLLETSASFFFAQG